MPNESDHDLLIAVNERVKQIGESLRNHLRHHILFSVAAFSATAAAFLALAILLLTTGN